MRFWGRLFGRAKHDEGSNADAIDCSVDDDWRRADCGFCGRRQVELDPTASGPYSVWKCTCGAIGSGAWAPDLDEVGDQLLRILDIPLRVSEPCIPTDHPAISMQHYDANKVKHDMGAILTRHGYEFCVTERVQECLFWVRRSERKV